MSRGGSSKSGIKLRETVSRCPKEGQKASSCGTFRPGRGEFVKAILVFVKRWPDL